TNIYHARKGIQWGYYFFYPSLLLSLVRPSALHISALHDDHQSVVSLQITSDRRVLVSILDLPLLVHQLAVVEGDQAHELSSIGSGLLEFLVQFELEGGVLEGALLLAHPLVALVLDIEGDLDVSCCLASDQSNATLLGVLLEVLGSVLHESTNELVCRHL
ncbi:hypothetical protein PMAYCL1PPCAC_23379, partial [Pristionchus mayeri]